MYGLGWWVYILGYKLEQLYTLYGEVPMRSPVLQYAQVMALLVSK